MTTKAENIAYDVKMADEAWPQPKSSSHSQKTVYDFLSPQDGGDALF